MDENFRNAWIEVKTKSDTCQVVAAKLRGMPEVVEADALFGDVDVLTLVRIDGCDGAYLENLERLINIIKKFEEVVTTVTRPVKKSLE